MAEGLSLAASIIAVTQLTQVTGQLIASVCIYYGDVKRAPNEIQKLADELRSLSTVLAALKTYADKNQHSAALKELAGDLAECTQEFQELHTKLSKPKKEWKKLWRNLKWPFKKVGTLEIISRIERHKTLFSLALDVDHIELATENTILARTIEGHTKKLQKESADHMVISKTIEGRVQHTDLAIRHIEEGQQTEFVARDIWRQREERTLAEGKRKEVLKWLFSKRVDAKHVEISRRRRKGTGEWLWGTAEVQGWISDPDSPILWGHGIPGAGKTFLSSVMIDHLEARALTANYGVAHIYFDYMEQDEQKAVHVLASLVKQLASQMSHLPVELEVLHDNLSPKDKRPIIDELYTVLLATFKSFTRVFFIFDALDECHHQNQRKDLLPLFHRIATNQVNLFVTSRPHPEDIHESFQGNKVTKIKLLAKEEDITIYIQGKIDESPRAKRLVRQGKSQEKIISELIGCAKGMFLLVRFHIDYICQQTTSMQILEALEKLKSCSTEEGPLDPTYNRAMDTLRSQSKSCTDLALKVLIWLVKATRPMTVDEIKVAVSVQPNRYQLDKLDLPDRPTLLDVCAGLVMIDEHSDTIRLVHYTVQEYLLRISIIPEDSDLRLAVACTTYLSFDIFAGGAGSLKSPFLSYAVSNLSIHLQSHDWDEDLAANSVLRFLGSEGNIRFFLKARYSIGFFNYNYLGFSYGPKKWTTLNIACAIGHRATVQLLLKQGANLSVPDGHGYLALHVAAYSGHEAIVQLLLDNGANISSTDLEKSAPLYIAAFWSKEKVVKLLLERGADISAQNENGETALHGAASGSEEAVRLLLDHGADFSTMNYIGATALHIAAAHGNLSVFRLLLNRGADISVPDNEGYTVLHLAVYGPEDMIRFLLDKGADISVPNAKGDTALHLAAKCGYGGIVRLLLDKGADFSVPNGEGSTALHLAARCGYEDVIQLLLDRGADPSIPDQDGWHALHLASLLGHEDVVRLLLDKCAGSSALENDGHENVVQLLIDRRPELPVLDKDRRTPLLEAASKGHKDVVRLLLDRGADISISDKDGRTALHEAVIGGHADLVRFLLDRGADVLTSDQDGRTPLHEAAVGGLEDLSCLLLLRGADFSILDKDRRTPLHEAAREGNEDVVRLLLDSGADLSASDNDGRTSLHEAAVEGHENAVWLLIDTGANLSVPDGDGRTALHMAASKGHETIVQLLIDKGADLSARENRGQTALHEAAVGGHEDVVWLLLDTGANLSVPDEDGRTALHMAAFKGHEATVQLLIDKGANLSASDEDGRTALHLAACEGHEATVQFLIDGDADMSFPDNDGQTALHEAANKGHEDVVRLLLGRGADPSILDHGGCTSLHLAADEGHEDVVRLLLDRGANLSIIDEDGCTALDLAMKRKHMGVVLILTRRIGFPFLGEMRLSHFH